MRLPLFIPAFVIVACPSLLLAGAGQVPSPAEKPPNIVLILVDDMGWKDTGATGSRYYQTPNIDAIAEAGIIFSRAYAAGMVCSPSRGALLSGKNPARTDLTTVVRLDDPYGGLHEITAPRRGNRQMHEAFSRQVLPLEEVTIAEALRDGGYVTAHFGKWHCGDNENYLADKQGFQFANRFLRELEGVTFAKDGASSGDAKVIGALTDAAVGFIEKHRDRPFFLYLSHYAVHRPLMARPDLIEKYRARPSTDQSNPVFAALIETLDDSVGVLDRALERLGLKQNTVLIFASDNGGLTLGPTSNYPLLGGKSFPYEAGVRTPLLIRWPGRIAGGLHSDTRVIHTDLYPTLLEMAGLPLRPRQHVDGQSLMPVLTGRGDLPDRPFFFHSPHYTHATGPYSSIVWKDWKLIRWYCDTSGAYSLFNLEDDPGELDDLSERFPGRVKELDGRLQRFLLEAEARFPLPNPDYDPSMPPFQDKRYTRDLAMKERRRFKRLLVEYEKTHGADSR
jgi:arylsulfatase A-like enzyme